MWNLAKIEHHLWRENIVNKKAIDISLYNKVCIYQCVTTEEGEIEKTFLTTNSQTNYCLKLCFWQVDWHTGGTWFINGTYHHKDNQFHPKSASSFYRLWSQMATHISSQESRTLDTPLMTHFEQRLLEFFAIDLTKIAGFLLIDELNQQHRN